MCYVAVPWLLSIGAFQLVEPRWVCEVASGVMNFGNCCTCCYVLGTMCMECWSGRGLELD